MAALLLNRATDELALLPHQSEPGLWARVSRAHSSASAQRNAEPGTSKERYSGRFTKLYLSLTWKRAAESKAAKAPTCYGGESAC